MRRRRKELFILGIVAAAALVAGLGWGGGSSPAQGMPILLQITSPTDGTVVHPGQTITIAAQAISGDSFNKVFVKSQFPIGASQPVSTPPYQLALTIPQKISAGKYPVFAYGTRTGQNAGTSNAIELDVEPAAAISKIAVKPHTVLFKKAGETMPLNVVGTFQDGSTMDIAQSTAITYTSADTTRATVDSRGVITAVAGGQFSPIPIVVQFGDQTFFVNVHTNPLPPPAPGP